MSDLKVGDTVMVRGTETDGVLTATTIREGALGFGRPPTGTPPGSGSATDSQQ